MSTFARKFARRKALRINFHKKLEEANLCLKDSDCSRAKIMGLKNSLNEQSNELSTTDDKIINGLEPENVEADVFDSMKIAEPYHEIEAELTLKLEELKINGTDKSSEKPNSFSVSSELPKIELPVFSGDLLKWQGFWDQFDISIHQNESISDIVVSVFIRFRAGNYFWLYSQFCILQRGHNYFDRKVWQLSSVDLGTYGFIVENEKS